MFKIRVNIYKIAPALCGVLAVLIMSAIFYSLTDMDLFYRIESNVGIITFIVTVPIFLLYSKWKTNDISKLAVFVLAALVTTLINPYASFGSFISLVTSMMMMHNLSKTEMSKIIVRIHIIVLIVFIIYSFKYSLIYRLNWWTMSHTYIGANAWGRYACFSVILLVILTEHFEIDKRIINIIFMIIAAVIVMFFRSRGALLCLLFFFTLYLIPYIPKDVRMVKKVFFLSLFICLIVPAVAVMIGPFLSADDMFEKSLFSGRDLIWKSVFVGLAENPLGIIFGIGANKLEASSYSGFVHNNLYGIIVNYGLFGLLIYLSMMYSIIKEKSIYIVNNRANWHAFLAVIALVFVLGTTEITSLWVVEAWFCYLGLGLIREHDNGFLAD